MMRASSLRRLFPLLVLALLLGAPSLFQAAPAQAQSTVLVSNIGQADLTGTNATSISFSDTHAQRFTTGSNPAGYVLGSIEMHLSGTISAQQIAGLRAELWSDDNNTSLNAKIVSLTAPSALTNGIATFTAPSNTALAASTHYFVVLYSTAGTSGRPSTTRISAPLDAGSASGWTIAGWSRLASGVQDPAGATWARHNVRKYRIRVNGSAVQASTDADLSGLTASTSASASGTFSALTLSPSTFAAATTAYTATVANARTHVKITPTTNDSNATVEVGKGASLTSVTSGSASAAIPLSVNANAITVKVTAQDGSTTKTYTVTVTRQVAAPAAPTNLVVAHDNRQLFLSWTAPSSTLTGYDVHYTSAAAGAVGNNAAASGSNPATAWVAVTRSGITASQTISSLTNGTDYRVRVRAKNSVGNSAWVFGTGAPGALWEATLTADQNGVYFGCDNSDANQDNCSSSTVLTEDQFRHGAIYTVAAVKWQSDNDRFYLNIDNVTGQATKNALTSLTLNVDGIPLRINAATVDAGVIYWSYNPDTDWTDGRTVRLTLRSAAHQATAPSTDAALVDLTATRSASASGTFSGLSLSPSFAAATYAYTASAPYAVTHVKLIPQANHPQATVEVGLQGSSLTAVPSGQPTGAIALTVGANAITVKVTAQDRDFTKTYTVTVTRGQPSTNAALSGLTATQGESASGTFSGLTLSPAFAAATTAYTASAPNSITYVKITPTASDSNARVEVGKGSSLATVPNGQPSGPISLSFGANAITVKVTAENGSTTNTYTVTVMRASAEPSGAPPAAATGTEGTLVSNTGQVQQTNVDFDNKVYGQAFTTGPYVDGYTLTGIEALLYIRESLTSEDAATVRGEVWSDSNGTPGTRVAYLTARNIPTGTTGSHTVTFTPSYGITVTLAANTTYHFVIYTTGSLDTLDIELTRRTDEDAGAADGWSIADARSYLGSQNTPPWAPAWTTSTGALVQIAVKGKPVSITHWAATLTVRDLGPLSGDGCTGQEQCSARLSPNSFKYGPWMYNILAVTVRNGTLLFRLDREPPLHDDQVRLDIGGRQFQFRDASKNYGIARNEDSVLLIWHGTGLDWSDGDTVSVSLVGKNVPAPPTPAPNTDLHPVRVHYDGMVDGEPVDNFNKLSLARPKPSTIPGTFERRVELRAYIPGTFPSADPEKGIVTTTHVMLRVTAHPASTLEWAIGNVYGVTGTFAAFANGGFTPAIALNPASKWTYVYLRVTNGSQSATHLVAIDPPPRTYTLTPKARVAEGAEAALTLSLGSPAGAGGVSFTVSAEYPYGGATAEDVGPFTATLTVPEGQQRARIIIPTVDDEEVEAAEPFTVRVAHTGEPAWAVDPEGTDTAVVTIVDNDEPPAPPEGPEPWDIRVAPGDGALTVTWKVSSRDGVEDSDIWHVLRWSQEPGVWNNPRDPRAVGRNDGLSVDPGLTGYTITGLRNGVATGVFVRSMVGHRNNMSERDGKSSKWVRVKGEHTTPRAGGEQQVNNPPTVSGGIADATIVSESGTRQVSLSGVFSDADGDALTITAESSDTAVATVSVSADYSTLTVTAKARGTAVIGVNAADGNDGEVWNLFTVTVKAGPVVASAIADIGGLEAGDSRTISMSGVFSDADGDTVTVTQASSSDTSITAVSAAIDGATSAITAVTVTAKSEGTATITVTARDADGNTVQDAFDVTVDAPAAQQQQVNNPPTVSAAIADATIVSESGTRQVSLSGVFSDADGDALTITAESSDTAVAAVSVSADYSTLTVSAQARGTAIIEVKAADGNGGAVWELFTVTVKAEPVVAAPIADVSGLEAEDSRTISMSGVFSDADGDAVTATQASSSDTSIAAVSAAIDGATAAITAVTVTAKSEGTATITVTARDADGNTVQDAFDVTVDGPAAQQQQVNNAPVVASALADLTSLEVGSTQDVSLSGVFSDADGDSLTVTASSSDDAKATVSVAADGSRLTVTAVAVGTATITVTAQDSDGNTVQDAFEVAVVRKYAALIAQVYEWRNDPNGVNNKSHTDRWDRALLAFGETVADGSLTAMTAAEAREMAGKHMASRWNPVAEALAEIEAGGQQQQATPNSAPTVSGAIADATIVSESGTRQVSLSGAFSDADGDDLTITAGSSGETVATVSVASDYSTLTVTAKARGTATITVTAADGNRGTVSDTFTVTVKAAPVVASALADLTSLEVGSTQDVSLSGVFSDADGDSLTVTASSSDDAKATVSVAADGSRLTVTAVAVGTATITVTAQDSDGNTVQDAFEVAVVRKYAALIAQVYEWRNDPNGVNNKSHTDRWDRALLAFGETVADGSLTAMTAAEAREMAGKHMASRWNPVAEALAEIEAG